MNNLNEKARGEDTVSIKNRRGLVERMIEKAEWKIARYANDADAKLKKVYSKAEALKLFGIEQFSKVEGNCLCNQGINDIWKSICGTGGVQYSNAVANLITGTGSGAATASDTEATFTAGVKKGMESGFPTYGTSQKATWKSSYGSGDANQVWGEFGVLNAASSGDLLNRKVSAQGTKTSGQTWELSLEITLS